MSDDMSGGLSDEREFVFAAQPHDPEMRESVNVWVWDDGGPVAMARYTDAIGGVARIGLVYTPPEQRGHGYAAACTAAVMPKPTASRRSSLSLPMSPAARPIPGASSTPSCSPWAERSDSHGSIRGRGNLSPSLRDRLATAGSAPRA